MGDLLPEGWGREGDKARGPEMGLALCVGSPATQGQDEIRSSRTKGAAETAQAWEPSAAPLSVVPVHVVGEARGEFRRSRSHLPSREAGLGIRLPG